MSFDYIRRTYKVPACRGARIEYKPENGEPWQGRTTSSTGRYLRIRRDGDLKTYPAPFHPTWNLTYLESDL